MATTTTITTRGSAPDAGAATTAEPVPVAQPAPTTEPPTSPGPPPAEADEPAEPTARARAEAGMATAEYAIGTVAAAAFAGLLLVILRSEGVRAALEGIITSALSVG